MGDQPLNPKMYKLKNIFRKLAGFKDSEEERRKKKDKEIKSNTMFKAARRLKNPRVAKVLGFAWPFLVLLIIFAFGWQGLKPYVKELISKTGMISERLFGDDENFNPDDNYTFIADQAELKPVRSVDIKLSEKFMTADELPEGISVSSAEEIIKALEDAKAGETIIIGPGEYTLNLEINQDITIYGQGSTTVLKSRDPETPVITVLKAKAKFGNLAISEGRVGISGRAANLDIERVKFSGLKAMGLWAEGGEHDIKHSYFYDSGQGIGAMNAKGAIEGCIIENNIKSGVELYASEFRISGNSISNNGSYGVFVDPGSKAEIKGNYIGGNRGFNVRIEGSQEIYW